MLPAFLRSLRCIAAVAGLSGAIGTAALAAPAVLPQPTAHGLRLPNANSWYPLASGSTRLWNAVVESTTTPRTLDEAVHVAVYLPADYDSQPNKRYPVLYLLHGQGDSRDRSMPWVVSGTIATLIDASSYEGIVVMPQCGKACWYTDWINPTPNGYKPQWETYYTQQLVPWIDANFRTLGTRATRAMAGISMGGYGALAMSMRFPHLFGHVASFSGAMNIEDPVLQQAVIANTVTLGFGAGYVSSQWGYPWQARDVQDVFGPYSSSIWRDRNPYAHADVYGRENIQLALYAGGGEGYYDAIEYGVGLYNDQFHAKLNASGSPHRYCRGARGQHVWSFWRNDLVDFLQVLVGQPPATCPNGWGAPR